jgi:hypothetical protein
VRLGDEGPLGASIALCTRAVPVRAELAAASARLEPERAAETLSGAQKWLGTSEKHTRNGCTVPSHPPLSLDNRSCHGVKRGVGCVGRALWSISMPLSEHRGPFLFSLFFLGGSQFLFSSARAQTCWSRYHYDTCMRVRYTGTYPDTIKAFPPLKSLF